MINNDHIRLAYETGNYRGFLKYGLSCLSSIKIVDQVGFDAAIEAAIKRIEEEAKNYAANNGTGLHYGK